MLKFDWFETDRQTNFMDFQSEFFAYNPFFQKRELEKSDQEEHKQSPIIANETFHVCLIGDRNRYSNFLYDDLHSIVFDRLVFRLFCVRSKGQMNIEMENVQPYDNHKCLLTMLTININICDF